MKKRLISSFVAFLLLLPLDTFGKTLRPYFLQTGARVFQLVSHDVIGPGIQLIVTNGGIFVSMQIPPNESIPVQLYHPLMVNEKNSKTIFLGYDKTKGFNSIITPSKKYVARGNFTIVVFGINFRITVDNVLRYITFHYSSDEGNGEALLGFLGLRNLINISDKKGSKIIEILEARDFHGIIEPYTYDGEKLWFMAKELPNGARIGTPIYKNRLNCDLYFRKDELSQVLAEKNSAKQKAMLLKLIKKGKEYQSKVGYWLVVTSGEGYEVAIDEKGSLVKIESLKSKRCLISNVELP